MAKIESCELMDIAELITKIAEDIHSDGGENYYYYYCQLYDIAYKIESIAQDIDTKK